MKNTKNTFTSSILTGALALFCTQATAKPSAGLAEDTSIRAFRISFSEEAIVDLRRRVAATKWPGQEPVKDASQGVQLATMRALARYWQTDYDWHKCEARLKALPHFV